MFTSTILLIFAAAAAAVPAPQRPINGNTPPNSPFTLQPLAPIPAQSTYIQAAHKGLFALLPQQNASCTPANNHATFSINEEGELNLYSRHAPWQKVYVDRSAMGQGLIGYTTGVEPIPANAETKGWDTAFKGLLRFQGTGLSLCPTGDGSYRFWLDGVKNPAGNEGCDYASVYTFVADSPPSDCLYTQE